MKSWVRHPLFVFGLVLLWRVLLLVFTAQPVPGNDAFGYDGAVVNFLHGGRYCNPSMALVFPISGTQVYSMYPPAYQGVLLIWMKVFGASALSAMAMHVALFAVCGFLTLEIIQRFFPAAKGQALAVWLLLGFTFDDRPEALAFVFGLAALWLATRQISNPSSGLGLAVVLTAVLFLGLYSSVIVGAYFFGAGFLACLAACVWRRNVIWCVPFIAAAVLFVLATVCIAKCQPLWWAGFQESARQQTVMTTGFHPPHLDGLLKLARSVPVFLLGLAAVPLVWTRRREIFAGESPWLALAAGILVMGWGLLAASVTLLAPNYVNYAIYTQLILAAGLLALAQRHFPARERLLRGLLLGCVLLAAIRAAGMTTWGAACAWKNSYQNTHAALQTEFAPFVAADKPVLVSSAFLYQAVDMGVRDAIHCDWYFDHTQWSDHAQMDGLIRVRPARLVLTQFDYYRAFVAPLEQLRQRPGLVDFRVRNLAAVPVPDANPALQRVVQHISWAPVIVDLDWKAKF